MREDGGCINFPATVSNADFAALPTDVPSSIRRLLQRCLEKDKRRRLRDIGDARLEVLDALENPGGEPTATGPGIQLAFGAVRATYGESVHCMPTLTHVGPIDESS